MTDCIFCKIVNKEIPSNIYYEDKHSLVFLDKSPVNLGHSLLIPKKHFSTIDEMSPNDLNNLSKAMIKISQSLIKISDGLNITQNNKKAAGQVVNHVHFHLIPRYKGDGYKYNWKEKKFTEKENKEFIRKINKYLDN